MRGRANAKINLTLDILGRRPDGYHLLSSVMQEISLCDEVTVRLSRTEKSENEIEVEGDFDCPPEKNLCYRAAKSFFDEWNISGVKASVSVLKRIPSGAGLGGGSSDGCTVIRLLAGHYGIQDRKRLGSLCLQLGADVPFFLEGGTQLMEGIGEKCTPLDRDFCAFVLLVKPECSAFSGEIYRLYDALGEPSEQTTGRFLSADPKSGECFRYVSNALEKAAVSLCREISELKTEISRLGADAAAMSGSGTAVYGLFRDRAAAEAALKTIQKKNRFCGIYEFI